MCIPQFPWVLPAKSLFFQRGWGVENKGSSRWQTVTMGETEVPRAVLFKGTWNAVSRLCGVRTLAEYIGEKGWQLSIFSSLWGWRQME